MTDYIGSRAERVSPASAAIEYRSLKAFFNWLTEEGEVARNPFARLKPPRVKVVPPSVYSEAEQARLLKACDGTSLADYRDAAMVRLLLDTGIRRGELESMRP